MGEHHFVATAVISLAMISGAWAQTPSAPSGTAAPTVSPGTAPAATTAPSTAANPSPPAPGRGAAGSRSPATAAAQPIAPAQLSTTNCVPERGNNFEVELGAKRWPAGPTITSATNFLAGGSEAELVLDAPYIAGTPYFGFIYRDKNPAIRAAVGRGLISARAMPEDHALVKRGVAKKDDTLIKLRLPEKATTGWRRVDLYIYTCAMTGSPARVSFVNIRTTSGGYALGVVIPLLIIVYLAAASAAWLADSKRAGWYRYLDPVYMTAGSDGRGSLSKLQILFFSLIVFALVFYIVLRTGALLELSGSILLLLGIAGIGSTAAKGADMARNRLQPQNWAWLIRHGWLPAGGWADINRAKWSDIVCSDGEFDVYRYQTCIFSLVVGVALLVAGVSELSSFTIPETLLGILGLSQVVYIGGKLVNQTTVGELNTAVTELREIESKLRVAAIGSALAKAPDETDLDFLIRRAGSSLKDEFYEKAKDVRLLFLHTTGRTVADANLNPLPA